jgi:hypothetical protein
MREIDEIFIPLKKSHSRERERGGGAAVGQRLGLEWGEAAPLPLLK